MNAKGTVHKFGDNVDTDVIIPARYLNTASHKELAAHCMEDIDADFVNKVKRATLWLPKRTLVAVLPVNTHQSQSRQAEFHV